MKKAIIILTLLTLITLGFASYEGYLYINSLNSLKEVADKKDEIVNHNIELENSNQQLEEEYNKKAQDLFKNDIGCGQWKNLEEVLKKIKE